MKTTVMAFGRMSPVTAGHAKLVQKVKDTAAEHKADHKIILSHTQDAKKNPLHVDDKVRFAKHYFPGTHIEGASKEHPTFLHHAKKLSDEGTEHLVMVAGSDRAKEYHDILHKYNGPGKNHNFKKITVVSAGERDPDAEGTEGMSASKLRAHAVAGHYKEFKSGLPKGDEKIHKEMYHKVRSGLKLECFIYRAKGLVMEYAVSKHASAAAEVEHLLSNDPGNKDLIDLALKHHKRAVAAATSETEKKYHSDKIAKLNRQCS
jgi:hypothetical protein